MKKTLNVSFRHEEENIGCSILVNGEELIARGKVPSMIEFMEAHTFVHEVCPETFNLNKITEELLESHRDGVDLARFAFAVGYHIAQSCDGIKQTLMMNVMTAGKNTTSEFVEYTYRKAINVRTKEKGREDAREYGAIIASITTSILLVMMQEMHKDDDE